MWQRCKEQYQRKQFWLVHRNGFSLNLYDTTLWQTAQLDSDPCLPYDSLTWQPRHQSMWWWKLWQDAALLRRKIPCLVRCAAGLIGWALLTVYLRHRLCLCGVLRSLMIDRRIAHARSACGPSMTLHSRITWNNLLGVICGIAWAGMRRGWENQPSPSLDLTAAAQEAWLPATFMPPSMLIFLQDIHECDWACADTELLYCSCSGPVRESLQNRPHSLTPALVRPHHTIIDSLISFSEYLHCSCLCQCSLPPNHFTQDRQSHAPCFQPSPNNGSLQEQYWIKAGTQTLSYTRTGTTCTPSTRCLWPSIGKQEECGVGQSHSTADGPLTEDISFNALSEWLCGERTLEDDALCLWLCHSPFGSGPIGTAFDQVCIGKGCNSRAGTQQAATRAPNQNKDCALRWIGLFAHHYFWSSDHD